MIKESRWDKILTKKGKKGERHRRDFVILYWYLLNKPDYNYNIAKTLEKIRGIDIPSSLTRESNLTPIVKKMCEKGLIEQYKTTEVKGRRRHMYKVLPELLVYPEHLEYSKEELEQIEERIKRDRNVYEKTKFPENLDYETLRKRHIYKTFGKRGLFVYYLSTFKKRNTPSPYYHIGDIINIHLEHYLTILEALSFFSVPIEKWMKNIDTKKKQNYIFLLKFFKDALSELQMLLNKYYPEQQYHDVTTMENHKFRFIKELDKNKAYEFFGRYRDMNNSLTISMLNLEISYYRDTTYKSLIYHHEIVERLKKS